MEREHASLEQLVIFARAPRAGEVKTRLEPYLGREGACAAYKRLLTVLAKNLEEFSTASVFFSPPEGENLLRPFFPSRWRFEAQTGTDLGERLQAAFASSFLRGARKVAIIGSDCPYISPADVRSAFAALDSNDLVLGPADDGGYWLVALRSPSPLLFAGVAWGSSSVLEQTMQKARELELQFTCLRQLSDVDTIADWEQFNLRK